MSFGTNHSMAYITTAS